MNNYSYLTDKEVSDYAFNSDDPLTVVLAWRLSNLLDKENKVKEKLIDRLEAPLPEDVYEVWDSEGGEFITPSLADKVAEATILYALNHVDDCFIE